MEDPPVAPTLLVPPGLGYRDRVEPVVAHQGGRVVFGFHPPGAGGEVVDVSRCLLLQEAGQPLWSAARAWFTRGPGREEPALRDGELRLHVRVSSLGKSLLAVGSPSGRLASAEACARFLREQVPGFAGLVVYKSSSRRGLQRFRVVWGRGELEEVVEGVRWRVPALSFAQVHRAGAARLAREVVRLLAPRRGDRAWDLYGGVGPFAWLLARLGVEVVVCDADGAAVRAGAEAARRARLRVRYVHARVEDYLGSAAPAQVDLVVADPPRTGLGPRVPAAIAARRPRTIVLVSCDPATFARDTAGLRQAGYELKEALPLDLFPQTAHVEIVASFVPLRPTSAAAEGRPA